VPAKRTSTSTWILALDPGTRLTGFCLGERRGSASHLRAELLGTIVAPDRGIAERLGYIRGELESVFEAAEDLGADVVTERPAVWGHHTATIAVARVGGMLLAEVGARKLRHFEYSPSEWKQFTGNGSASKDMVAHYVRNMLNLPTLPAPDAADAAGMFIYHATRN
jgi:crossover junction endodeoxyribonuclease RuvC